MLKKEFKIKKISAKNFKGIEDFEKEIDGNSIVIGSDNGNGKTSLLQFVLKCLYNEFKINADLLNQDDPEGESTGEILLVDENGQEWPLTYKNKKTSSGRESQTFELITPLGPMKNNNRFKALTPPPYIDFNRFILNQDTPAGRRKNIAQLLLPHVDGVNLDLMYDEKKELESEAKAIKKEASDLEKFLTVHGVSPEDILRFSEKPIDIVELQDRKTIAEKIQKEYDAKQEILQSNEDEKLAQEIYQLDGEYHVHLTSEKKRIQEEIKKLQAQLKHIEDRDPTILRIKKEIDAKKNKRKSFTERKMAAENWFLLNPERPNTEEIEKEILQASETNARINNIMKAKPQAEKLQELRGKHAQKQSEAKKKIEEIRGLVMQSGILEILPENMIIDYSGDYPELLHINEQGHQLQMTSDQIETSQLIMHLNELLFAFVEKSALKTICVPDASLLGKKRTLELCQKAEERGLQVLLEKVVDDEKELRVYTLEEFYKD